MDSRTEDDLEVCLAEIAYSISRRSIFRLVRIRPTLIQWAVPGEARLARTLLGAVSVRDGVGADANVAVTSLHDREVISTAILAGVLAVAELEESLCLPLTGSAPLSVTGKAHAKILERSGDGNHLLG